ncbi:hypothetical protein JYT44_03375, partial [Caldithrix abyssi]|nr:hypothetical protein [Caldithrix abyssi]
LTEKNIGNNVMYSSLLNPWLGDYCQVILQDSKGKTWPYRGHAGLHFYQPDYLGFELKPKQSRIYVNELGGIFGDRDENHRFVFRIPPGHYTLKALINTNYHWRGNSKNIKGHTEPGINNVVDKRTVYSNIVEFEIVEPKGAEKNGHTKLLEAYRLTWQIKKGSNVHNQIIPILKSILDDHPVSAYYIAAHNSIIDFTFNHIGYQVDPLEDIVKFKDQIYCHRLIQSVGKKYDRQRFDEIKKKHPNSRLANYIDHEF